MVHAQSRYPIGRVRFKTAGTVTGGTTRLVLWDAEASGTLVTDRGKVHWRSFAASTPSVIVIAIEGTGGEGPLDLDWLPAEARPPRKVARREPFAPEDLHPPPAVARSPDGITSVQAFINGAAPAESIRRAGGRDSQVFYLGIGYGAAAEEALAEAERSTAEAERLGVPPLAAAHRAWWLAAHPGGRRTFPNPRLESYYWIQLYMLGAAMRADGPLLDLNGPWFRHPPRPDIWSHLRAQRP